VTKINLGAGHDDADLRLNVVTDGLSNTEIETGDRFDRSTMTATIYDLGTLRKLDPNVLARELCRLGNELQRQAANPTQREAARNIIAAKDSTSEPTKTGSYLLKAGKWALEIATKIGTPVAEAALKATLGL
jgi:hypothetical protein